MGFIINPFRFISGSSWATALTDWVKRKSLTINGAAKTADTTDDFSSDTYTDVGSSFLVTGGVLQGTVDGNGDGCWKDLGLHSDTSFVMRFKFDITAFSGDTGNPGQWFMGLSDTSGATHGTDPRDGLGLVIINGTSGVDSFNYCYPDNTDWQSTMTAWSTAPSVATYWVEIIRHSATKVSWTLFSDSDYSVVVETTGQVTIPSTIDSLRYFMIQGWSNLSTSTTTVQIDDLSIWDGVTVVENIPSPQSATFTDDFTGTDDWTDATSTAGVNVSTDRFEFIAEAPDAANDSSVYDLGAGNVSDTEWTLRWEITYTAHVAGNGANHAFGITQRDQTETSVTTDDGIMFCWGEPNTSGQSKMGVLALDGTAPSATGTFPNSTSRLETFLTDDTKYYLTLSRVSAEVSSFTIKTGSHSGPALAGFPVINTADTASTLGSLRYIKFLNRSAHGNRSGSSTGFIENIQFYNGISEVNPATLTDYPLTIKIKGDAGLQEKTAETLEDLFTTDNFTHVTGSSVAVTGGEAVLTNNTTKSASYIAVGSTLSETAWVCQYKFRKTEGTYATFIYLGAGTSNQIGGGGSGDFLGGEFAGNTLYSASRNGGTFAEGTDTDLVVNTDYWITMTRKSATLFTVDVYSDSARTILFAALSSTITSGIASLDTFYLSANFDQAQNGGAVIDDLRIWNGITNPVTQETATFTDDFSGTDDWTDRGTSIAVSTSNDRIDWDVGNGSGSNNDGTWYDLGAGVVDTTKWLLTAKIHVANRTQISSSSCHIGVGLTDTKDVPHTTNQDSISFAIGVGTGDDRIYGHHSDSQGALDSQRDQFTIVPSDVFSSATSVWLKLVRNGSNTMIASVYSDESMSTLLESKTTTMAGTPANLRYVMVNGRQQNVNVMDGYVDDIKFYNGLTSTNAEGRKIVFTDNAFDGDTVEYASETISYDPINGDLEAVVKVPTLTAGADNIIQMYYDYTPSATPSYVPAVASTPVVVQSQDFSSDTLWTHSSKTSISSGALNWQNNATGTNYFVHSYRSITPSLKDDYFDVRFKLDIDVLSGSGNQDAASISWIVCDANNTDSVSSSGTATGIGFRIGFGTTTYVPVFEAFEVESSGFNQENGGDNIDFATTPTTGIIYIRLHRTSVTSVTVGIYSDPDFALANLIEEETLTITSNIKDLDIFQISTRNGSQEVTRSVSGTIDDLQIMNEDREQATWDINYKAVYNLHGNSVDSTSNGNNGTDTAVTYEQQNNSVGAGFNATTTKIDIGSDASIDNIWASGGTISFDISPITDGELSTGVVMEKGAWWIRTTEDDGTNCKIKFNNDWSGVDPTWTTTNAVVPLNTLSHIEIIYNNSAIGNDPIFVINGIKFTVGNGITQSTTETGVYDTDAGSSAIIGNGATTTLDGFLDNVRISNVSRPSSGAITSYNAEKADSDMTTAGEELTQ